MESKYRCKRNIRLQTKKQKLTTVRHNFFNCVNCSYFILFISEIHVASEIKLPYSATWICEKYWIILVQIFSLIAKNDSRKYSICYRLDQ